MLEIKGDIWSYHKKGQYICITTNGVVKENGECVMGRGVALQAKQLYPFLPKRIGDWIKKEGNIPYIDEELRIITLPVKNHWKEKADIELIKQSILHLKVLSHLGPFYTVRPGCGNGGLDWEEVKNQLNDFWDSRMIIVNRE